MNICRYRLLNVYVPLANRSLDQIHQAPQEHIDQYMEDRYFVPKENCSYGYPVCQSRLEHKTAKNNIGYHQQTPAPSPPHSPETHNANAFESNINLSTLYSATPFCLALLARLRLHSRFSPIQATRHFVLDLLHRKLRFVLCERQILLFHRDQ